MCEGVPVARTTRRLGTPLYLYSYATLTDHLHKLQEAFRPVKPLICYSMKANSSAAICRALSQKGAGFDVVSGGELTKALRLGVSPAKIVFASVGKTEDEIRMAVKARIRFFNVESLEELIRINAVCRTARRRQSVSLRFNPDVDVHTHAFITTGSKANKFGLDAKTVRSILSRRREFPFVRFEGIHIHIGSQILDPHPYQKAIRKALSLIAWARQRGIPIRWLNIGGGLGIVYQKEKPQTAAQFARAVLPLLSKKGLKVILEPGRFIVGNSGILLTRVLYLKESHGKNFAIVDAGMNDLIRPSLYGAYHEIVPVVQNPQHAARMRYDVVGPVCESGDFLAKGRWLPTLHAGDFLAVMGAGAYGFVMSSNYNLRPRAAEVLVRGNRFYLVRARETHRDLVRNERLPDFLT